VAICTIELTDILFAVDSVPTVIAVVRDPFVALTSNIAAILGLRALYFVFENLKNSFWLLNKGLALILGAVGLLLLFEPKKIFGFDWFGYELPTVFLLIYISIVLVFSVIGSIVFKDPGLKNSN
jgi:tellurite resistance protein TerC